MENLIKKSVSLRENEVYNKCCSLFMCFILIVYWEERCKNLILYCVRCQYCVTCLQTFHHCSSWSIVLYFTTKKGQTTPSKAGLVSSNS